MSTKSLLFLLIGVFIFSVSYSQNSRIWATYYGDTVNEEGVTVVVDDSGNVYMAGKTASPNGIAAGGFQTNYGGGAYDAFIVKFDSSGQRQWATYYGGL